MKKINDGHYLELMDRIHVLMSTLNDHIIEHPVSESKPKIRKKLDKVLHILWETYQIAGELSFKHKKKKK